MSNPSTQPVSMSPETPDREVILSRLRSAATKVAEIEPLLPFAQLIEPDVIAVIEAARHRELDEAQDNLLFWGMHMLANRRLTGIYRPLASILSNAGEKRAHALLGDCVTETLPHVFASVFDGDPEPLQSLVLDPACYEFTVGSAFGALTVLAFDSRIDRNAMRDFLVRFERQSAAEPGSMAWHGWMIAIALLGFEELDRLVMAAYDDGRITGEITRRSDYRDLLRAALERPDDRQRFTDEHLGYIDDLAKHLKHFEIASQSEALTDDRSEELELTMAARDVVRNRWLDLERPVANPYRHVGRNDPCPCGSGKKFKRCCMAQ